MSGLTRRGFLAGVAGTAGGLVVGCSATRVPAPIGAEKGTASFDAWIHVTPDDRVLLLVDKVEMGQGTQTGFATLVGEELSLDPARIEVQHAGVDERFDPSGIQATGGSRSLADRFLPLREGAARARVLLEETAAERWSVPRSEVRAKDGEVVHERSGQRLSFGAIAADAAKRRRPESVTLKAPSEFRFIGKDLPRVDGAAKSRGEAMYGIDANVPGLLHAVVVHPPHPADEIVRFDAEAVRATPGVRDVFAIPTGVAIVANGYWAARKAAGALALETKPGDRTSVSSAEIREEQRRLLRDSSTKDVRDDGDVDAAREGAARVLDVEYFTPHQSHATMEPMNCTVAPNADGTVAVYMGTQAPGVVRDVVADVMDCGRDQVTVHTMFLGGGFGRRVFPDVAFEAATIARRVGAPVKLVYSREDDMSRDFFRPATAHRFRAALDADGRALSWEHRMVAPPMLGYMAPRMAGALGPEWMRGILNSVGPFLARRAARFTGPVMAHEGAGDVPYAIPNVRVESVAHDPGIQVGIWRSVGHSNNGFVVESFVDELAAEAGRDPLAFRRELLRGHPRHLACLDLVAEKSAWGSDPARHQGLAVHESFGTVVAEVAEVEVNGGEIRVLRVVCAVHCGLAVNPDVVRAQIESGVVFGLTATLKSQITFRDGVAVERNFDRFPMLRMDETPEIEVHIVPSADPPTGVGEPGTPPIPAAVANAVFAATGVRLRELPLRMPS